MRILFTGASSFTGYWFVKALAEAGHEVIATFRKQPEEYVGTRRQRVAGLRKLCEPVFECDFGGKRFLEVIGEAPDLLCHHAAEVTNYKSPDFDVATALANNTNQLPRVLDKLMSKGTSKVLLTGTVFEANEGKGDEPRRAFSPYALSKTLTAEVFQYHAAIRGMNLGKFVIPHPFGPFEEPRFTTHLVRSWYSGQTVSIDAPLYVRDNVHVSLLAKAYAQFAQQLSGKAGFEKMGPTGYAESHAAFAARFARELSPRLEIPCPIQINEQTTFSEARIRINVDPPGITEWSELEAWNDLADYYREAFGPKTGFVQRGNVL